VVLRAFLAGIQKLEVASGEIPLFAQALGCPGRDSPEHVVVLREQLAQLRAEVGF
jgi:hypothetical protein